MKTKELIRQLQENDPSGELEVSVGNCDIYFVERQPGYYDGCQQVLIHDESLKPYWTIVGGRINATQDKLTLKTMAFSDLLSDNPEMQIDTSELSPERSAEYQRYMEKSRQVGRDIARSVEWRAFREWAKEKTAAFPREQEDDNWEPTAEAFFDVHLWPERPMPNDLINRGDISWHNRRRMVWDREIEVSWDGLAVEFRMRNEPTP